MAFLSHSTPPPTQRHVHPSAFVVKSFKVWHGKYCCCIRRTCFSNFVLLPSKHEKEEVQTNGATFSSFSPPYFVSLPRPTKRMTFKFKALQKTFPHQHIICVCFLSFLNTSFPSPPLLLIPHHFPSLLFTHFGRVFC